MKKKTSVLLTLLALSVIVTCGFVNFANAQFFGSSDYPDAPDYSQPTITIHTPTQNATYEITYSSTTLNLPLNFTITKPENSRQSIVSIWYILDNCTPAWYTQTHGSNDTKILIKANDTDDPYNAKWVLNYTLHLQVGSGAHSIKIGLEEKSYYITRNAQNEWTWPSVMVSAESEPIMFTVSPPPTPTPTATLTPQIQNQPILNPTDCLLLIGAIAVAVVAPILIYRKLRKQQFHS